MDILPDEIIIDIMSNIGLLCEIARMRILSKRFFGICMNLLLKKVNITFQIGYGHEDFKSHSYSINHDLKQNLKTFYNGQVGVDGTMYEYVCVYPTVVVQDILRYIDVVIEDNNMNQRRITSLLVSMTYGKSKSLPSNHYKQLIQAGTAKIIQGGWSCVCPEEIESGEDDEELSSVDDDDDEDDDDINDIPDHTMHYSNDSMEDTESGGGSVITDLRLRIKGNNFIKIITKDCNCVLNARRDLAHHYMDEHLHNFAPILYFMEDAQVDCVIDKWIWNEYPAYDKLYEMMLRKSVHIARKIFLYDSIMAWTGTADNRFQESDWLGRSQWRDVIEGAFKDRMSEPYKIKKMYINQEMDTDGAILSIITWYKNSYESGIHPSRSRKRRKQYHK